MKNFSLKKAFPYIVAILLFTVLTFVYFSPVIEGKILLGHDSQSYLAMSKESRDYEELTGDRQFWTNSMFGGMPTYQISTYMGKGLLKYIHYTLNTFPRPASFLFLYLLCGFLLLRSFRVNPWLSIAGSILFAFASYNLIILAAGHNTKAMAIAYIMPLIGSVALAYSGERLMGGLLTAVFLGLAILANHLQILYYTLFILIVFFVVELIYAFKDKKIPDLLKTTGVLIIAAIIGIGANAASLLTTYEYSKYTMRGESNGLTIDAQNSQEGLSNDYITQWSYGIDETLTLLIPDYKGGASGGTLSATSHTAKKLQEMGVPNVENVMKDFRLPLYWGTQPFTSGPVYIGAIACLLFVLGLFIVKGRYKWWLLSITILSVLLAWGRNFMPFTEFFINYIPLYNKFRTVSMTLVIAGISMPLLGILALKNIFDGTVDKEKAIKALLYSISIVGGICLLFWVVPSLAGNFVSSSDAQFSGQYEFLKLTLPMDRKAMLSSDAFRSLVFVLLTAGVLYFVIKNKLKTTYAVIALGILFVSDLFPVAQRYLNSDNFVDKELMIQPYKASAADKAILKDKSPDYRVLNLTVNTFNDAAPSYFHENIGGYSAVKMRRYQELINVYLDNEINSLVSTFNQGDLTMEKLDNQLQKLPILNMLNMKYVIINPNGEPIVNPHANSNAWLVDKIHVVKSADEEMTMLGTIDTKKEMVFDPGEYSKYNFGLITPDSTASIVLTSYEPMKLKYHFEGATDQMAVFSEIYYDKGWNAYIKGEKATYIRANYLLRAMPLKAGDYDIEFRFEPQVVKTGDIIAIISSILIILLTAFLVWKQAKKKYN